MQLCVSMKLRTKMTDANRPNSADSNDDDSMLNFLKERYDPVAKIFKQYRDSNKYIVPISVTGLLIFLIIALAFPFKDRIFERLYPKPKSQAAVCSSGSQIPSNRAGFVFTGGDLQQAISALQTPLYYSFDLSLGQDRSVYIIGRYAQNQADPLGLKLLMENNLSNADFRGLPGKTPSGWNVANNQEGSAAVDRLLENTMSGGTSIKLSDNQVTQTFKKAVSPGQMVVFGSWVKTGSPANVKVSIQNAESPNQDFGAADNKIEPDSWTYVTGYGKVPPDVTSFQLALKVSGTGNTALFGSVAAAVINPDQNQAITDLVLQRCGSAWMIDDGPGWEQTFSSPFMKPVSANIYALLYHQFYTLIKNADPSAKVLPGGLMGAPVVFDSKDGYSPQLFLDNFRSSYRNFFNSEPPIDALAIRYLATESNRWSGAGDLEGYLGKLRTYIDQVPDWKDKPIWISRLAVSTNAPNGGVDFMEAAVKFLAGNTLNIEKWFWYDTCGFNSQLASLFVSRNKICSWPMKLTALGEAYLQANATPTPAPTLVSVQTATPSATVVPTPTPVPATPTPVSTSSGILQNETSTESGAPR